MVGKEFYVNYRDNCYGTIAVTHSSNFFHCLSFPSVDPSTVFFAKIFIRSAACT